MGRKDLADPARKLRDGLGRLGIAQQFEDGRAADQIRENNGGLDTHALDFNFLFKPRV
jgi:hypothetical protein